MPDLKDLEREVHLYYLPATAFDGETLATRAAGVLSEQEHQRAGRFAFEKDRRSYTLAHWLLRNALSQYLPIKPSEWEFHSSLFGKPQVNGPPDGRGLRFNLSHSRGMVACGVTMGGEVGVDVETIRPRDFLNLASRFFAPEEVTQLECFPKDQGNRAFFRFWTLKEAYVKARGQGLSLDLSRFAFLDVMSEDVTIQFDPGFDDQPEDWQFFRYEPDNEHQIAAAVHRPCRENLTWRVFSGIETAHSERRR